MTDQENQPVFVYTTFETEADARRVGEILVKERLAACVNLFDNIHSIYRWQGKVEQTSECAMFIKTRRGLVEPVLARTKALHSYDTPALVTLPLGEGDPDYLDWVRAQTQPDDREGGD
jgi:periplasmic divalent cation tolerance protein